MQYPPREKKVYLPDRNRPLPGNLDAERGILSCLCLNPRQVGSLCAEREMDATWFQSPAHGVLFAALLDFWDSGRNLDEITLLDTLTKSGNLENAGGADFVRELFVWVSSTVNAEYYLNIITDGHTLRSVCSIATEFACRSYEPQIDIPAFLDDFESRALQIRRVTSPVEYSIKQYVTEAVADIRKLVEAKGAITGLSTGLKDLDGLTDGMHPEELIILAARPGVGKSTLAANIIDNVSVACGKPCGWFSLEMSGRQLLLRQICARSNVSLQRIKDGKATPGDIQRMMQAADQIKDSDVLLDHASGTSISRIKAVARRWKQDKDIQLLVVDYLQLVHGSRRYENRNLEVSEVSGGLKELARELKIPIIALSQLNRAPATACREPRLSDLRDSGSIEQDADTVIFLHREDMAAEDEQTRSDKDGEADMIIAKQRSGPLGRIALTFLKDTTRFVVRSPEAEIPY
jgi:replicative DNA helicase